MAKVSSILFFWSQEDNKVNRNFKNFSQVCKTSYILLALLLFKKKKKKGATCTKYLCGMTKIQSESEGLLKFI